MIGSVATCSLIIGPEIEEGPHNFVEPRLCLLEDAGSTSDSGCRTGARAAIHARPSHALVHVLLAHGAHVAVRAYTDELADADVGVCIGLVAHAAILAWELRALIRVLGAYSTVPARIANANEMIYASRRYA